MPAGFKSYSAPLGEMLLRFGRPRVLHGVPGVAMPEIILHGAQVRAPVGKLSPHECRSMCGCTPYKPAPSPATRTKYCTDDRVRGCPRADRNSHGSWSVKVRGIAGDDDVGLRRVPRIPEDHWITVGTRLLSVESSFR